MDLVKSCKSVKSHKCKACWGGETASQHLCAHRRGEESKACTLEANKSTFFSTSAFSSRSEALGFLLTKSTTLWMHSFCRDD